MRSAGSPSTASSQSARRSCLARNSGAGADLFRIAGENDLEGIVSKPIDKPYHSGRRPEWLKTKCVQSDTFVIIGYQTGGGAVRTPFANIKVATLDGARLRYAGEVGTGFSEAVAVALRARLDRIATPRCPIAGLKVSGAVWVSPDLRAEIAYCGTGRQLVSCGTRASVARQSG